MQTSPGKSSNKPKRTQSAVGMRGVPSDLGEASREIEMQKAEIAKMQARIFELERALSMHEKVNPRPMSRERLPPMDGFSGIDGSAAP